MQQPQSQNIKAPSWNAQSIDLAPGEALVAVEGTAWVTASHDSRDIILSPGSEVRFKRKTRAIVSGFGGREVTLRKDAAEAH